MPNSIIIIIIIASSQATLEEAIKHDIVSDLGEVVFDSRHDSLAAWWTPSTIGQASTCRPTNATASRAGHARNQLIDELFHQGPTAPAGGHNHGRATGQNHSVKTKHHPPEHPAKPDAILRYKIGHEQPDPGPGNHQSEARTEDSPTTNRQPQIVAPLPCNCDYDQLLNSIIHEQVDVNRRIMISTANEVSRYCDSNPHAHHNRTADRSRFPSNKPLL